jgi:DNA-binding protein HU-beta
LLQQRRRSCDRARQAQRQGVTNRTDQGSEPHSGDPEVLAMTGNAQDSTQRELVDFVARQSGIEADKAEAAVRALVTFVESKLATGEAVLIPGLGKFAIEKLEGAEGRNPATGAAIKIPAFDRPVFFAAKSLKDAINK